MISSLVSAVSTLFSAIENIALGAVKLGKSAQALSQKAQQTFSGWISFSATPEKAFSPSQIGSFHFFPDY